MAPDAGETPTLDICNGRVTLFTESMGVRSAGNKNRLF